MIALVDCVITTCNGTVDWLQYYKTRLRWHNLLVKSLKNHFLFLSYSEAEREQRLKEVTSSIYQTGSYTMTNDELEFASKTAWRNASRCIGRIQWSKLKVNKHLSLLDNVDI